MPAVTPYRIDRINKKTTDINPVSLAKRAGFIYKCLLVVSVVFVVRLFYIQVIKHDYYHKAALLSQLKQYVIPAERGNIYAYDGENPTPLVLNEKKYTLYADPKYVKDPLKEASEIAKIIGGDINKISDLLKTPDLRYVIIAKKLTKEQSNKLNDLNFNGVGTREESYRTYPNNGLAAQLVGFVNDEGKGQYGLEGYYDEELGGTPGYLKAITDSRGIPLASNQGNTLEEPVRGKSVNLTIDVNMQRIAEDKLKEGLQQAKSKNGSVIILDSHTGAVKAMASYPSFDPSNYSKEKDASVYKNAAVADAIEPGSIMKPLLIAAALDSGGISPGFTFTNTGSVTIDGLTIKNSHQWGIPVEDLQGIMQRSLNTGVVAVLQAIGGGEINQKARNFWYDYLTNHYFFGQATGIEQTAETSGTVPKPDEGYALNFKYANMTFGQGLGVSLIQMAAAANSVINGGNYYKPYIVDKIDNQKQTPKLIKTNTVSKAASDQLVDIMVKVANSVYFNALRKGYIVGGKTGTAEVAGPDGSYYTDRADGTFFGFVGGNHPDYTILVISHTPDTVGSAGIAAAEPIFANISQAFIDNGMVSPAN